MINKALAFSAVLLVASMNAADPVWAEPGTGGGNTNPPPAQNAGKETGTPPTTIGGSTTEGQPVRLGEKVINGAPANANNWPGISSLRLYEPDTKKSVHFCGGSAIAKNWVLTAGHCMNDLDVLRRSFFPNDASRNIKLQVVIGSDNLETVAAAAVFDVDEADIRVPDNYKMAVKQARQARDDLGEVYAQGDIALIKLTKAYAGPLSPLASTSEVEAPEA